MHSTCLEFRIFQCAELFESWRSFRPGKNMGNFQKLELWSASIMNEIIGKVHRLSKFDKFILKEQETLRCLQFLMVVVAYTV